MARKGVETGAGAVVDDGAEVVVVRIGIGRVDKDAGWLVAIFEEAGEKGEALEGEEH